MIPICLYLELEKGAKPEKELESLRAVLSGKLPEVQVELVEKPVEKQSILVKETVRRPIRTRSGLEIVISLGFHLFIMYEFKKHHKEIREILDEIRQLAVQIRSSGVRVREPKIETVNGPVSLSEISEQDIAGLLRKE